MKVYCKNCKFYYFGHFLDFVWLDKGFHCKKKRLQFCLTRKIICFTYKRKWWKLWVKD